MEPVDREGSGGPVPVDLTGMLLALGLGGLLAGCVVGAVVHRVAKESIKGIAAVGCGCLTWILVIVICFALMMSR